MKRSEGGGLCMCVCERRICVLCLFRLVILHWCREINIIDWKLTNCNTRIYNLCSLKEEKTKGAVMLTAVNPAALETINMTIIDTYQSSDTLSLWDWLQITRLTEKLTQAPFALEKVSPDRVESESDFINDMLWFDCLCCWSSKMSPHILCWLFPFCRAESFTAKWFV